MLHYFSGADSTRTDSHSHWALNLANLLAMRGHSEQAFEFLALGVRNARVLPPWVTLLCTALVASANGYREMAAVFHGAIGSRFEATGALDGDLAARLHRDGLGALRADGTLDADRLYESGRRMSEDEALRLAAEFVARHVRPDAAGVG